ncbi:MAG: winged helix-turn-helix transcriptional regulator, partial [Candidatus Heimdallarchaeota archaeon]|nr:winged helix-turn-helix transcriptional regulator [Candidatus Heimdallarchaeota archaeon]
MKLTRNDRRVLKFLIENGRSPDADMARGLNITPQAVGKIRRKLESEGIVKGYSTIVDYGKLGINVLAIALFKFTQESRKTLGGKDIDERIKGPHIID